MVPSPLPCASPHSFGPDSGVSGTAPATRPGWLPTTGPSALTVADELPVGWIAREHREFDAFDSDTERSGNRPAARPTFGAATVGTCGVARPGRARYRPKEARPGHRAGRR